MKMQRALRLCIIYMLEVASALLALSIFAAGAVLWRLAEGPIDAEFLRPSATNALLTALEGDAASIGSLQIGFDPASAALVITARDVSAARAGGEVILTAERVETALALDLLLVGRAAPVRITADGGAFSLVRDVDGRVFAGLGGPDSVRQQGIGGGPGLGALASGLQARSGVLSRLTEIDLRNVDLQVHDGVSDTIMLFREARASLVVSEGALTADMSGGLITSAGLAGVELRLETGREFESLFMDLRVRDLVPAAAAPRRGLLSGLASLDAPVSLDLVIDASVQDGLRAALVELDARPGVIRLDGEAFELGGAVLSLGLDANEGVLEINTARIESQLASFDVTGRFYDLSGFDDALPSRARYELASSSGWINPPGVFSEPVSWGALEAAGGLDRNELSVTFERLEFAFSQAVARLTGRISAHRTEEDWLPSLQFSGPIEGELEKADVLRHWPVGFALGARDWVRDSIMAGRLHDIRLDLDIPYEAFERQALDDDDLSLVFSVYGADVRYMVTMTPLTGLSGRAELRGNSLSVEAENGRIGAIAADTIFVNIPAFQPKGVAARFGGTGRGEVSDLITLVDQPPLGVAQAYGLDPQEFEGRGHFDFEIRRPMLRTVPPEDLGYTVTGSFEGVSTPSGIEGVRLDNGALDIEVTEHGVLASAEARLAGAPVQVRWTEVFGLQEGEASSRIRAFSQMSGRHLDQLGLPLRRFLDGVVNVQADVTGRGFDFSGIEINLDLEPASIILPGGLWEKEAGEPARASFGAVFGEDRALTLENLEASGPGAEVRAQARLAEDGRLLSADAERVFIAGRMDLAARADRPEGPDGPLRLQVAGPFLDAQDLFGLAAPDASGGLAGPLIFEGLLETVLVRGARFENVDLSMALADGGVERFVLAAQSRRGAVELRFATDENDPDGRRRLRARSDDAGLLLSAFTGFDNARGGVLKLDGTAPPLGTPGGLSGTLDVETFTLERMPLLARVLAAGSLDGLAGLLGGQGGVAFERLVSDFIWEEGVLEMRESRVAGPSLGVTWTGVTNFPERRLEISGTLLPSYGANSVLGSLPIVGELFTSRRGEGVFGVTFAASGPFESTRITANPLSALAPGVFRRIFEGTSAERELQVLEAERRAREADAREPRTPEEASAPEDADDQHNVDPAPDADPDVNGDVP